jgi:triacylglycerol lipase
MLAPPNKGTEIVDIEKKIPLLKSILGPAGKELGSSRDSIPNRLGPIDFEAGIIAGDRSIEFYHSPFIPGRDDGKVSVENTKVAGMKDFIVVHRTHTFIMNAPEVLEQSFNFITRGEFKK